MENNILVCVCGDISHQLVVSKDKEDSFLEEGEVIFTIHLNRFRFLQRVKIAFLYLFGKQSKYGAFEEVLLSKKEVAKLLNILQE